MVGQGGEGGRCRIEDLIVEHAHLVLFGKDRLGVKGGGGLLVEIKGLMGVSSHDEENNSRGLGGREREKDLEKEAVWTGNNMEMSRLGREGGYFGYIG